MRVPSPMAEGWSKSSSSILSQKREENTNASLRMSSTSEAIQSTEQKPQSGWYGIFLLYENKIKTIEGLIIKKKKAKARRNEGALKCLCLHTAEFPHRVHPKNKKRVHPVYKGCEDKVGHLFSFLGLLFLWVPLRRDRPGRSLAWLCCDWIPLGQSLWRDHKRISQSLHTVDQCNNGPFIDSLYTWNRKAFNDSGCWLMIPLIVLLF